MNFELIIDKIKELHEAYVIVTMVNATGSAPQEVGSKCIVTKDGLFFGTVGGGKIEAHCIKVATELIENKQSHSILHKWNLQTDIKMTCGGVVEMFFDVVHHSKWPIAVFGAGHIVQSLVPILLTLECDVTVIDTRADWLEKLPSNKKLKKVQLENIADYVQKLPENTFILSISMGHAHDVPVLKAALRKKFPFIGVIGSDSKRNALKKEILSSGFTETDFKRIHCPLGEDFGNNTPPEIALSVAAQIIKARDHLGLSN